MAAFACTLLAGPATAGTPTTIYTENFDIPSAAYGSNRYASASANLGSEWSFYSDNEGRNRIYDWQGSRGGVLIQDDHTGNDTYSLNEAILTLDLSGYETVDFSIDAYDAKDEEDEFVTSPFTGHANADGVAVSSDGTNWYPLIDFDQDNQTWKIYAASISDLANANVGLSLTAGFQIKIQQYDNYSHGSDGRKYDTLVISGTEPSGGGNPVVPEEPSSFALLGVGSLVLAACGYRRRRRSTTSQDDTAA
ncbi:MAG: hypothetical protein CMJ48_11145 [Planctomycetaceae bacterium]|nr:hypothetical protein [Planctomycetaceae bacterium]